MNQVSWRQIVRDKSAHSSILIALLLTLAAPARADDDSPPEIPVRFALVPDKAPIGALIELQISLSLPPDQMIYSASTARGFQSSLTLDESAGLARLGSFGAGPIENSSGSDGIAEVHRGLVTFRQQLIVTGNPGTRFVEAGFNYARLVSQRALPAESASEVLRFEALAEGTTAPPEPPKGAEPETKGSQGPPSPIPNPSADPKLEDGALRFQSDSYTLSARGPKLTPAAGGLFDIQLELHLKDPSAYIYGFDDPSPSAAILTVSEGFKVLGIKPSEPSVEKMDEAMGLQRVHKKHVAWTITLQAPTKPGPIQLKIELSAQICDALTCLPFSESMNFNLDLSAAAPSAGVDEASKAMLLRLIELAEESKKSRAGLERKIADLETKVGQIPIGRRRRFDQLLSYHHDLNAGLDAARKSGRNLFLAFTGHNCQNCRLMESTVLIDREVTEVLDGFERVVLHVDDPSSAEEKANAELLSKGLKGSAAIPAYYLLRVKAEPGPPSELPFEKIDVIVGAREKSEFIQFLRGGRPEVDVGWGAFILSCIGLGLLTLLMPCTYPMIPITISIFSKGGATTRSLALTRASIYAAGIVVSYTAIGGAVQLAFGSQGQQIISQFALNPWVNVLIGGLFLYFAFSFFGYYDIAMPSFLRDLMQRGQPMTDDDGGVPAWSLFMMGTFFMLTSYSCGAPFVLAVFERAAATPHPISIVLALFIFSSTIALPFVVLALVPTALKSMPRSGNWFNTFKVGLGFFELAFALKFLSTTDIGWHLGLLTRPVYLGLWIMVFVLLGIYLLGGLRFPHDTAVDKISMSRFILALLVFSFAVYLASWFAGQDIWPQLDALLPPDPYPGSRANH
jgi:thiol:disulfide interchange protein